MAIPIVAAPEYELKLPSTGKKIKYRPFLVKEEKILLLAMETKDPAQIQSATKQVIGNCTFGQVDVDTAPPFDLEFVLLQLRIRSVGETASVGIKCSDCGHSNPVDVDLASIQVSKPENHSTTIKLTDSLSVMMRYPTIEDTQQSGIEEGASDKQNTESAIKMIARCIEVIQDGTKTYKSKDFTPEEVVEFLENLSQSLFMKIMSFFSNMPTIKKEVSFACSKCSKQNNYTLRGIKDFFTS